MGNENNVEININGVKLAIPLHELSERQMLLLRGHSKPKKMNGWWVCFTAIVIFITCYYLVVLFNNNILSSPCSKCDWYTALEVEAQELQYCTVCRTFENISYYHWRIKEENRAWSVYQAKTALLCVNCAAGIKRNFKIAELIKI